MKKHTYGDLSIDFAAVSLVLFPLFFAFLGFIFGFVACIKEKGNKGIVGIILSVIFGGIGMVFGALSGAGLITSKVWTMIFIGFLVVIAGLFFYKDLIK